MRFFWKLGCLLSLALVFCNGKTDAGTSNESFRKLMDKTEEKKSLPDKLAAVREAYAFAVQAKNITWQTESIRREGALCLEGDSLEQALILFRRLVQLAEQTGDKTSLGIAFNNTGLILSEHSVYDSAIVYYEKAAKLFSETKDSVRSSQCYINMGIAYKNTGSFEKAFSVSLEAARIMETRGDSAALGSVYTTLGNTMKDLRRPQEALTYHRKAIGIRERLQDSAGVAGSLNNIGNVYKNEKQYGNALNYYLRSLRLKTRLGLVRPRITSLDNIAETYFNLQQYALAEKYESEAIALRNRADDLDGWMQSANRLAKIYLAQHELAKAEPLAIALSNATTEPNYVRQRLESVLLRKDIYATRKKYDLALLQAERALSLQDSLFSSDLSAEISKMNVRFQTEEQQKKLELARNNAIIQEQRLGLQKYFIILLGSTVVLLLVITYLLYASNRLKKKSREYTELLMSELNHRVKNNIQIISAMLNLQKLTANTPDEINLIEAARNRIQSIGVVHKLLYQKEYTGLINMRLLITELSKNISLLYKNGTSDPEVRFFVDECYLSTGQAVPVGLILNELVTNIHKYGRPEKKWLTVLISLVFNDKTCTLCVKDNGREWNSEAARAEKKGVGLQLIAMLCQQLNAGVASGRSGEENFYCINFSRT